MDAAGAPDRVDRRLRDELRELETRSRDPRLCLVAGPPSLPCLAASAASLVGRLVERTGLSGARGPEPRGRETGLSGARGPWPEREAERHHLDIGLRTLADKCRWIRSLLAPAAQTNSPDRSQARQALARLSLTFSHVVSELQATFPDGQYRGQACLEPGPERDFWTRAFGHRTVVPWGEFRAALFRVHRFGPGLETAALRCSLDLTCNGQVSAFEFRAFTRLYQPWATLPRTWLALGVTHPGYGAFLTYDQVAERLRGKRVGSYLYRLSCTHLGLWAIGYIGTDGSVLQTLVPDRPLAPTLMEGKRLGVYLYPDGKTFNPDLTGLCQRSRDHIPVSKEQYLLYCEMGSSFELCKICTENDKDVQMKPCGHLICDPCLMAWRESDGHTCPFCRATIRGTQRVVVHPFTPVLRPPLPTETPLNGGEEEVEDEDEDEEDNFEDVALLVDQLAALRKTDTDQRLTPGSRPPVPPRTDLPRVRSRTSGRDPRPKTLTDSDVEPKYIESAPLPNGPTRISK